jgi:cellulose synthase (UDP-forming)
MNPKVLLALWRERWGKPGVTAFQVPYIDGRVSQWGIRIAQQMRWSLLGILVFVAFLVCLFSVVLLPVVFSNNGQIVFSVFLVCSALFLRRHAGVLPTLTLIGLSFIASTRYLYWRFSVTLGHEFDWAYMFGFALCLAEFYLCLQAVLDFIEMRWPIKRAQSNLRNDSNLWPSVDIFVLCAEESFPKIQLTAKAAVESDWPERKIKIFLLDDKLRDDIKSLADSMGIRYLVQPDQAEGKVGGINAALLDTKGDLIVVLESGNSPDKTVLQNTVGWFLRDAKLGLLLSPRHFLAPEPSKLTLDLFDSCDLDRSFAMMRRSMLVKLGDGQTRFVTDQKNLSVDMRGLGYECAYVGLPQTGVRGGDARSVEMTQPPQPATSLFRVNQPALSSPLLTWRIRLSSLQTALDFYQPLPHLIFLLAPLPYLFGGISIIQANFGLFATYAVPHLLHWYMAKNRMNGKLRLTAWVDVRESMLAAYLAVRTVVSLIQTEVDQLQKLFAGRKEKKKPAFDWLISLPFGFVMFLNLIGLIIGVANFPVDRHYEWDLAFFYLFWGTCNLLVLAALAAVAEESRHIRYYRRLQLSRPAMIKLPLGRSLSCVAENFPEEILVLRLPMSTTLKVGSEVYLSIFRGNREYGFPAQVNAIVDCLLHVRVLDSAQADYLAFGQAVYSRGKHWPEWLPGRDADSPLPRWLYKSFDTLRTTYLNLRASYRKNSDRKNSIFLWKKKK